MDMEAIAAGARGPTEWYRRLPPVTRAYVTGVVVLAVAAQLGIVGPLQLYFNYRLVFGRRQWWRLVTPFLYFGPVNFDFIFHLFFLLRYCRLLEEETFAQRPADFLWMLLVGASAMLLASPLLRVAFLSPSLVFMIVYVWSRKNPTVMMNFLGVFNFYAPAMPWVLLFFSLAMSGQIPVADVIGIAAGHTYYYLTETYPRISGGRQPLATPGILAALINPPADGFSAEGLHVPAETATSEAADVQSDGAAPTSAQDRAANVPLPADDSDLEDEVSLKMASEVRRRVPHAQNSASASASGEDLRMHRED